MIDTPPSLARISDTCTRIGARPSSTWLRYFLCCILLVPLVLWQLLMQVVPCPPLL